MTELNTPSEELKPIEQDTENNEVSQDVLPSSDADQDTTENSATLDELPLPDEEGEPENKNPLEPWVKKRLARAKSQVAKRDAEIAQLKSQLQQVTQPVQPIISSEELPKREQYASEDAFISAQIDYQLAKRTQAVQQEQTLKQYHDQQAQFFKKLEETTDKGHDKYEDFHEVVQPLFSPDFPPNRPLCEAILDSEYGSDILYFLGKYPDKAKEIALMQPIKAIKKVADLEARFKEKRKTNPAPTTSKPLTPLKSQSATAVEGNPEKMDMNEFKAWYQRKYGQH